MKAAWWRACVITVKAEPRCGTATIYAFAVPLRQSIRFAWLTFNKWALMNAISFAAVIGIAMALAPAAHAAELRVLAGGAMTGPWGELKPKFEQASGHNLDVFFGTTPNLIKEATS